MKPAVKAGGYLLLALVIVGLRLYSLSSDPPSWLSWSSGIYSDEGIYACDARSIALFGHPAPGDFHSSEIAPLHTATLLILFKAFGVSLAIARSLSVATSLTAIFLFYQILKRQYDETTGVLGVIFLGLSPVFLFYNRLALLETPTVCLLVIALYLQVTQRPQWLEGFVLALAIIYKPLAVLCVPAFFVDFRENREKSAHRLTGMIGALVLYFLIWQLPHRDDLQHLNRYYILHQYLPRSWNSFKHNLVRSLWSGSSDGILPYLCRHTPVLLAITLFSLGMNRFRNCRNFSLYSAWLALPVLSFCLISYAPSRYFVLFFPAIAAIGAVAVAAISGRWKFAVVAAFVALSAATICVSFVHRTDMVERDGMVIGKTLPANSRIVGQYAPEFAMSNNMICQYVQPGLANYRGSVGQSMVLVTRSPFWSAYWDRRSNGCMHSYNGLTLTLPHGQSIDLEEMRR